MIKRYQPGDIVLDGWELVSEIGSGGYSTVYEARREEYGHQYTSAIKIIPVPRDQSELDDYILEPWNKDGAFEYFRGQMHKRYEEVIRMDQLKGHSNVVSYQGHKVEQCEGGIGWDIIIRMELLTPLKQHLGTRDFTRRDAVQLGIHICNALELCHSNGIHHRDVKLDNIFLSPHGDYKLGDLGIARKGPQSRTTTTRSGSDDYLPPEFFKGEESMQGDLYALGVVLYKLANNCLAPFRDKPGDNDNAWIRRLSGEAFPAPAKGDARLNAVILKACAVDPADRYQSAAQMRSDLEALLGDGTDGVLVPKFAISQNRNREIGGRATGRTGAEEKTDHRKDKNGKNVEEIRKRARNFIIAAVILVLLAAGLWAVFASPADDVTVMLPELVVIGRGSEAKLPYTLSETQSGRVKLVWSSSDEQVAQVDQGMLTGVSAGEVIITVTCGQSDDTCRVLVVEQDMDGQLYELEDAGWYYEARDAGVLIQVENAYYWHDAGRTASAELLSILNQAALQELEVQTVTEKTNWLDCYRDEQKMDYCGSVLLAESESDETVVVIHKQPDTYILRLSEISPPEGTCVELRMEQTALTLEAGEKQELKVYFVYEDNSVALAQELTWSCEDDAVVRVENGVVEALAPGRTVVTAAYGEFSCECTVEVPEPEVEQTEKPTRKPDNNVKPTAPPATQPPAPQSVSLSGAAVTAMQGETVSVAFQITKASFNSYDMKLRYDTSALTLTEVRQGSYSGYLQANTQSGALAYTNGANVSVKGTLFTATFQVAENAAAKDYTVSIDLDYISEAGGDDLKVSTSSGKVTVKAKPVETEKPDPGSAHLSGSHESGLPGDTVTVAFRISEATFNSCEMGVRYDSSVLTLVSLNEGGSGLLFADNPDSGRVGMAGTDVTYGGTLFKAKFRIAEGAAPGTYPVSLDVDYVANSAGDDLTVTTAAGSVTVDEAQTPTPPPTEEPAGRAPQGYTISTSPSTVFVNQPFWVTVTPDVSDYTKIVIHGVDPTGGRWDKVISSGNSYDLLVYDENLTGTWTFYADVYNPYGVYEGASSGARTALTVYPFPLG